MTLPNVAEAPTALGKAAGVQLPLALTFHVCAAAGRTRARAQSNDALKRPARGLD